jgi:hypothetical protein
MLIQKTSVASSGELELQSHWAKYLCVLVSGLLENALVELYREFSSRAASEPVANFAGSRLAKIQNPNAERFVQTARSFKIAWGDALEAYLESDGRKDAIDSVMNNRHQIAHGKNAGITVAQVRSYLDKAEEVLNFIERQTTS